MHVIHERQLCYCINVMILCMNNYVMSALGVWIGHVFKNKEKPPKKQIHWFFKCFFVWVFWVGFPTLNPDLKALN